MMRLINDFYSTPFLLKVQVFFWYESSIDTLHTQNINPNESIRDVEILCYLSDVNTMIIKHSSFNFFYAIVSVRGEWTTRMRQVFYDFTTFTEYFVLRKYLCLW